MADAGTIGSPVSSVTPLSQSSTLNQITSLIHLVIIKLTHDNFLLWKAQMVLYLKGWHLYDYIDGTKPTPFILLAGDVNPAHTLWTRQDQVILCALISSLFEPLITQVIGLTTTRTVWLALDSLFAFKTQGRLIQIHFQLATLKKGSEFVTDYFYKTKLMADTMAAIGKALFSTEFTTYLLIGLGSDFDSLVTFVTNHLVPPSTEEIFSHLLTHEAWLTHQTSSFSSPSEVIANVSTKNNPS